MKYVITIILVFCVTKSFTQRETENWYFGDTAGLNFNNGSRSLLGDGVMSTPKGSASISDKNGALLFYTDGVTVWNKNHQIMVNGDNLDGDKNNMQPVLIIPKPGDDAEYFIITTSPTKGLNFATVTINSTNPLGIVTKKSEVLASTITQRLTAIHHSNGKDIWLLSIAKASATSHNSSLLAFKVDENGISTIPIPSPIGVITATSGPLKISPDGKWIALATDDALLHLIRFDKENGTITQNLALGTAIDFGTSYITKGVAFSQDSEVLYTAVSINNNGFGLLKVDLTQPISTFDTPPFGGTIFFSQSFIPGEMQLALDGKIYIALSTRSGGNISPYNQLAVIDDPNNKTSIPIFRLHFVRLDTANSTLGLPNFIQSYFASRILTENKCYVNAFHFTAISYTSISAIVWDFGDGTTANGLDVHHTYARPGNYTVKATATINGSEISIFKNVTAYELPVLTNNQFLEECDPNFDGKTNFNLNNIHPLISSKVAEESISFFLNQSDAINDSNPITNASNFENSTTNQQIWARVSNNNQCFEVTSFTLQLNDNQLGAVTDFFSCEIADAKGDFDINTIVNQAKNQLGLAANTSLKVYPTLLDAQTNTNEISGIFTTASTRVFIKGIAANNSCAGITSTNLVVNPLANLAINPIYEICYNPFSKPPVSIQLNKTYNAYLWKDENGVTVSTTANLTLTKVGNYTVSVTTLNNGITCITTKTFEVKTPPKPQFSFIDVDTENESNNKITIQIQGNSNYQFSLDNQNFVGSGNQHEFTNVTPGIVTVFVKDVNDCEEPIQTEVAVIGFKKFFSPNADGNNDVWTISGLNQQSFKSVNIRIYNRFGVVVGSITNFIKTYWDGNYNNKPQMANTYWFTAELIDLNDKVIKKTGNFSLIRD